MNLTENEYLAQHSVINLYEENLSGMPIKYSISRNLKDDSWLVEYIRDMEHF